MCAFLEFSREPVKPLFFLEISAFFFRDGQLLRISGEIFFCSSPQGLTNTENKQGELYHRRKVANFVVERFFLARWSSSSQATAG